MSKLIELLQKHFVTIVFFVLLVFCGFLLFGKRKYQRVISYNISNSFFSILSEKWDELVHIANLRTINDSLANENAELKNKLEKYRINKIPPIKDYNFSYISAQIFSKDIDEKNNLLRINKGKNDNVEEGMGVVCTNGVVGFVFNCGSNYSNVIPIINKNFNFNLSVKLLKNNYYASLSWDGQNVREATVTDIPEYVIVELGDTVVTSNLSTFFPENIPIGVVTKIETATSSSFLTLTIKLSTDYNNLSYVYVLRNSYKPDITNENE